MSISAEDLNDRLLFLKQKLQNAEQKRIKAVKAEKKVQKEIRDVEKELKDNEVIAAGRLLLESGLYGTDEEMLKKYLQDGAKWLKPSDDNLPAPALTSDSVPVN